MAINNKLIKDTSSNSQNYPVYLKNTGELTDGNVVNFGFDIGDIKFSMQSLTTSLGWHLADGSEITATNYPKLFNKIRSLLTKNTPVTSSENNLFPGSRIVVFSYDLIVSFNLRGNTWWHATSIDGPWTSHTLKAPTPSGANIGSPSIKDFYKLNGYYIIQYNFEGGSADPYAASQKTYIDYCTSLTGTWAYKGFPFEIAGRITYEYSKYWYARAGAASTSYHYKALLCSSTNLALANHTEICSVGNNGFFMRAIVKGKSNELICVISDVDGNDSFCYAFAVNISTKTATQIWGVTYVNANVRVYENTNYVIICISLSGDRSAVAIGKSTYTISDPFTEADANRLFTSYPIFYNNLFYSWDTVNKCIIKCDSLSISNVVTSTNFGSDLLQKGGPYVDMHARNHLLAHQGAFNLYYNPSSLYKINVNSSASLDTKLVYTNRVSHFPAISSDSIGTYSAYVKISD